MYIVYSFIASNSTVHQVAIFITTPASQLAAMKHSVSSRDEFINQQLGILH